MLNILFRRACDVSVKSGARNYYKEPFSYEQLYLGKFDYHDPIKYPKRLAEIKEEELLDDVHSIKAMEIENPSPFHIVRRIRSMNRTTWYQKVTLRRLNLHSTANGDVVIVPNTPQFNALLAKVKHLIQLKPAIFVDGRVPTQEDIGAVKVCPFTGRVKIDEKLRLLAHRLNTEKPIMYQGNFLRSKLLLQSGVTNRHYMS